MGLIYGNQFLLKEHETCHENKEIFNEFRFIVFEEYCNYSNLLESCTDENTKAILEAKCEVLYEVSIKDIKNTIINFLKRIKEMITNCIQKIKEFFTKQKQKDMEEKIRNLEQALKDKDIEISKIKAERNRSQKNEKDLAAFAKSQMNDHEKQYNDLQKELEKEKSNHKSEIDDEKKKVKHAENEALRISLKLSRIMDNIVDNDLLYFDAYDFLPKDFDPAKIVRGNLFTTIMNDEYYYKQSDDDDNKYERRQSILIHTFEEMRKYANVIPENLAEKYLKNGDKNVDLSNGAYQHSSVFNMIRTEIHEKKEKQYDRFCTLDKLLDHCKWLTKGFQINAINEAMNSYNSMIGKIENFIIKLGGNSAVDVYNRDELVGKKIQPDNIIQLRNFIKELDNSVRYMAVLVNYSGRASGAASQAIIVLSSKLVTTEE